MIGLGTAYHAGLAVFSLCTGNAPMFLTESVAALKSYAMGELLAPVTEPLKEAFLDGVEETCDPDIVDSLPFL